MVIHRKMTQILSLALFLLVAGTLILSAAAMAEESGKTVRVGWHEAPYFITDPHGRWSGYTYDYQQKLVAFTNWRYEYVEGTWSELLQMLKDGDIDLMGNISYTEERARDILYASLPMGTEVYYLFVPSNGHDIVMEDVSSLNGRRVGVAKGSIQSSLLADWARTHGATPEIVELSCTEDESLQLLGTQLDAFVTMDIRRDAENAEPLWKIGSSDFYFAVSKSRPDLLVELNTALSKLQDENKYYNQQLNDRYLRSSELSLFLTDRENEWLVHHGTVRVGYQDKYLAFCAADENGELTGALKDYLEYASTAFENAHISFETVCYPTSAAAIEAVKKGEVDCMFPANLTPYEAEKLDVLVTPALMTTEMDAVVRAVNKKEFVRQKTVAVAVNEGNTNYDMFLADNYPGWQTKYYPDTPAGLEAVAAGEADCVILSNYRYNNIARQCERLHLTPTYTGVDLDYSLALRRGDLELYSILSKITAIVPASTIHSALTYYSSEEVKTSFSDLVKDNLFMVMAVIAAVLVIILLLLLRSIRAERKAMEEERMIKVLNAKAFVDALTSVRNKGAFVEFTEKLQQKVDQNELVDYAIGVFDCDDLKSVNDVHGHDKGDEYIKAASRLICHTFQHSPVFRIGGDEFAVVLMGEDFKNREKLVNQFGIAKDEATASAKNAWEKIRVSFGIAQYDPQLDSSVNDTARRADKIMYENKRSGKEEL